MKKILFVVVAMATPSLAAADSALAWISKIHAAATRTSYQGTFVYRQGDQMEVMSIAHRVGNDGIRERLFSLNGWAREIIRNNDEVVCYLPDKKAAMAGHRLQKTVDGKFPELLPEKAGQLTESYRFKITKAERIAGRKTMLLSIDPRDQFRYGYRLWADRETGLLLKSDLLDGDGKIIEQFMFTNVEIGKTISDQDLQPTYRDKGMIWHRAGATDTGKSTGESWSVEDLPAGYRVIEDMVRNVPGKQLPVAHLVISDGLAAISVFIEKSAKPGVAKPMVTAMGAAHAYRSSINGHKLTVMGEVPQVAVERIARSVHKVN